MQKFADDVSILDADNSLVPLADATVTVYDAGTTNLASIFSDNGVTSASNPLTVGDDGSFEFYAANGRYDLLVEKSPYKPHHEYDITLHDIEDDVIDEDDMASDSDAKVPTQQSVKAYVDSLVILYGTVTLANTILSLVNGAAFFDPSVVSLLTELLGCKLTVTSKSTGAKIVGYIKAAGTGETLGDEQLTQANAASDPNSNEANATTGWATTANNTLTSDSAAPQAGTYDLKNVATTAGVGMTRNDITLISGALYKSTFAAKAESGAFYWRLYNAARTGTFIASVGLHPATWTTYTYYACPNESTAAAWFYAISAGGAATFHIDNHSFRQVLTPSATGVTITSTPGGTTYNWASIEIGFNYNDASGYTYKVSPAII